MFVGTSGNKPPGKLETPKGVKEKKKLSLVELYRRK
jgi:hypothetical protein